VGISIWTVTLNRVRVNNMAIQSESARDKQILAFGRRQRVVEAAILLAVELVEADFPLTIRQSSLVRAVRAYEPKAFGLSDPTTGSNDG
jgi:hypothetical protein